MLNKEFAPPPQEESKLETEKRLSIVEEAKEMFSESCPIIFVAGSMATSRDYGVHADSDIDMLLLTTPETVENLKTLDLFDADKLDYYIEGYLAGHAKQFSLEVDVDGVMLECHFWDKDAYLHALKEHEETLPRFRSTNEGSSINYGFGFAGEENETDYPTETIEDWYVSPFPFYEREGDTFYPGRPITNLLGTPILVEGASELEPYIDELWQWMVEELKTHGGGDIDLDSANLINAMPGNWKFSDETRAALTDRMKSEIELSNQTTT